MQFHQIDKIKYCTFESLTNKDIFHAIFTRQGGVSPAPWATLNFGGTVGDDRKRVLENQRLALNAVGVSTDNIFDVWQVHSSKVVVADAPRKPSSPHVKADAIITNKPDVALLMRFADCVPVLLFDPIEQVIGIVHAGWQGTLDGVVYHTVKVMDNRFTSKPENIIACIGPSIGAHHYSVGEEVVTQVERVFKERSSMVLINQNGDKKFDLWTANRLLLEQAGVRSLESSGICTVCELENWFSHRGEFGDTGRFGVLIQLNEK
jgi:YfiH family protein